MVRKHELRKIESEIKSMQNFINAELLIKRNYYGIFVILKFKLKHGWYLSRLNFRADLINERLRLAQNLIKSTNLKQNINTRNLYNNAVNVLNELKDAKQLVYDFFEELR